MGRNSKRTLLGTIALVMLFALTAYAADILDFILRMKA